MTPLIKILIAGMLASALVACSSSGDGSSDQSPDGGQSGGDTTGTDGSGTTTGGTGGGTVMGGAGLPPVDVANSGGDRNSCSEGILSRFDRTVSEVCSLGGPSRTDANRTDERPSAPIGLTALLVGEDWIEIDWVPSVDDGEVVAYKIYRDGNLVRTLDQEPDAANPVNEERDFRTTTYIDCNYTKNPTCDGPSGVGRPGPGGSHVYRVSAVDDSGNESDLSVPATFRLNAIDPNGSPPDLVAEGYEVTFFDDFVSDGFDEEDNWVTNLSFDQFGEDGRAVNSAQQYFVDTRGADRPENGFSYDPFEFRDGVLAITAVETPPELLDAAGGQPYLSGAITTRSKVGPFEYGYVEMRAKVPAGNGLLSTFFLFQPSGNQYEIDILEYLGREPDGATQNYHYRDGFRFPDTGFSGVPHASPTMFLDTGEDLSQGFHTYSVLWEPGLIVYYIDEREVRRLTGPRVADVPMDIVAQLVVGTPNFAGDPTSTPFPVSYEIDYVRVYRKP